MNKYVVLAGGVGAARFLEGLVTVIDPSDLTVIVNTGDDEDFYGLHVCPDIDTILYTLSGNHNEKQGWGIKDETYTVIKQLKQLGHDDWFSLGDKDFATHIHRTQLLKDGQTLTDITQNLARSFSLPLTLLPMANEEVRTMVETKDGMLSFQEYFVKRRHADRVLSVHYKGVEESKPSPGVLEAIDNAHGIIIAPSNPIVSIGTILAVPQIRDHLQHAKAKIVAVSPLINGKALKGPADTMLHDLGLEPSAKGIANYYHDFLDTLIIDNEDASQKGTVEKQGISVVITNTLMEDLTIKRSLAQAVVDSF
jgi:LPPG:FO 2-phospho-L-lactate transferase